MMYGIKIIVSVVVLLLLGFAGHGSAEPISENEMFPDIPDVEKIVWHCDEGATVVITYTKSNEWQRTVIMTLIRPYATESKPNGRAHYFVMSPDSTKFLEISFVQFRSDMEFLGPKHLRGEPNDCVDGTSLRHGM